MSVAADLKTYLVAQGLTTDDKITVSRVPAANLEADDNWVIVAQGGSISGGNLLQWKRTHQFVLLYRNKNGNALYDADDALITAIGDCVELAGYRVLQKRLNPMTELELNGQETHVGTWQLELAITKKDEES